ncbi:MAG: PHP domain-containing protein [bacterium]
MSKTVPAELHTHSTHSDGAFDVPRLASALSEAGVRVWALTDHDAVSGCAEATELAKALGMRFVPGIEVSAYHQRSVHVLGLGVDVASMDDFEIRRRAQREIRMAEMVARLCAIGVEVDMADVREQTVDGMLTRPHLARALQKRRVVPTVQDAFDHYLAEGRPAYVGETWPSVEEAIDVIHSAGGLAILAHPGIYGLDSSISSWIDAGLDGIEVGHPKHTKAQTRAYTRAADKHKILKTLSSDYHGPATASVALGQTQIPEQWLHALLDRLDR